MIHQQTDSRDNTSASIDVGTVLSGIWAKKHWIVLTTLAAAAASVLFVATAKPEYQAESRVLVENLETDFSRTNPQRSSSNPIGQQEVKSQVEVLHSRDLAKKVIKELNLTERREFDPLKSGVGPLKKFLISLGFKSDPAKQTPEQRALGVYYKKLTAYQIPESKVIVINMKSASPDVAANVANTLGRVFVSDTRAVQSQTTGRARDWLADQINSLRKKVIASEVAAEKFRAEAGLLKGRDQNTTLSNQELSELNSQIILAEAQRSEIQARAKSIRNLLAKTGSVASSSEVLNSQLIQRLRERQINLRGNLAELSTTYLPNHPRVASVQREINGLNRQIRSEALKIVSGLEQQAKVATAREASLRASLNKLKTQASGTNIDKVKLRALEREAKANRTLLETFLTKYSDASSRDNASAQPGLARVISTADVPTEPSFPKPGPTVILATLGGLVLSLGVAFMAAVMKAVAMTGVQSHNAPVRAKEPRAPELQPQELQSGLTETPLPIAAQQLNTTENQPAKPASVVVLPTELQDKLQSGLVRTPEPVGMSTPSLSQLPASSNLQSAQAHALSVLTNKGSAFSSGLAPVSSWASSNHQTLGQKRLCVVGMPGAELDTAVLCLGLARSLAAQNITTIIVDAAVENSQLAVLSRTVGLPGLAELLTGHASFADVIIKDDYSAARLLRVGQFNEQDRSLLASDRMETVLAALEGEDNHDIVIVHGGVLSDVSGNMQIDNGVIEKCQSSLLVVSGKQTDMAGNALQQLESVGLHPCQYVRIADGGGLRQIPDNIMSLNAAYAAGSAQANPTSHAVHATATGKPTFSKLAP